MVQRGGASALTMPSLPGEGDVAAQRVAGGYNDSASATHLRVNLEREAAMAKIGTFVVDLKAGSYCNITLDSGERIPPARRS